MMVTPNSIESAIARIRAYAKHQGWSKSRLADRAGMHDTVLRDFDKPDWNPTTDTIRRIEAIIPADFEFDPCKPPPPSEAA